MAYFLGSILGFYIFYAIFAAIFKHKAGLIIASVLGFSSGILYMIVNQDASNFIATIGGTIIIYFVKAIQIRKDDTENETEKPTQPSEKQEKIIVEHRIEVPNEDFEEPTTSRPLIDKPLTYTYIDNLTTRNLVKVEKNGYVAYSYEDYFMEEWLGNINIFFHNSSIYHATTTNALSEKELEECLDRYLETQN